MNKGAVTKKTWDEFRASGLLWWINSILHMFGWAITVEVEDGVVTNAYPARVIFRGFGQDDNDEGFKKVSAYLRENAEELDNETNEIYE